MSPIFWRLAPVHEVLCEGACVDRLRAGAPIQIGRLQRYATDYALHHELRFFQPGPPSGRRVAIVGAGPAGLACAHELRCLGDEVTIFEARDVAGGLNTLGIAAYKITRQFSLAEIQPILDMGVQLRLRSPIDGPRLKELLTQYDAVFLAVGLGSTHRLQIPGEEADGVWEALEFIRQCISQPQFRTLLVGRRVVVIGCGNTAIDAATAAVRLGAERVTIAYRRSAAEMTAYAYEYELAKADGVVFEWHVQPLEFLLTDGRLSGVRLSRRSSPAAAVEECLIPCDMAIKALGQAPLLGLLSELSPRLVAPGRVVVDPRTMATPVAGLFAGGDCISGGAEIVHAVQEGKLAARAIHQHITAPENS